MRINGSALRTIRMDREVPITDLARRVDVEYSHLSNIEAGRRNASASLIRALARELKCDVLALLGPDDPHEAVRDVITGDGKPKSPKPALASVEQ